MLRYLNLGLSFTGYVPYKALPTDWLVRRKQVEAHVKSPRCNSSIRIKKG